MIIGAARGIGLEFVRQHRSLWDRVIATARDSAGLKQIEALGARAIKLNVAEPASMTGLARQLEGEKIDIALYVSGRYTTAGANKAPTSEVFDAVMHINVLGAMQAIPVVAPLVEAAGGKFVFVSSEMGRIGGVDSSFGWTFRASKAALNMVVASAQHDYPAAIMVAISPGWVKPAMGGPGAPLDVERSVLAMCRTIDGLTRRHKGSFLNYDGRRFKSW